MPIAAATCSTNVHQTYVETEEFTEIYRQIALFVPAYLVRKYPGRSLFLRTHSGWVTNRAGSGLQILNNWKSDSLKKRKFLTMPRLILLCATSIFRWGYNKFLTQGIIFPTPYPKPGTTCSNNSALIIQERIRTRVSSVKLLALTMTTVPTAHAMIMALVPAPPPLVPVASSAAAASAVSTYGAVEVA